MIVFRLVILFKGRVSPKRICIFSVFHSSPSNIYYYDKKFFCKSLLEVLIIYHFTDNFLLNNNVFRTRKLVISGMLAKGTSF